MSEIRPQPGAQETFLATSADIAIYGGAAGGGKTWALLLEPLRHIKNPNFGAVIFRRTFPQITREGGMWDESAKLYPVVGGRAIQGDLYWRFPGGSKISFAHLQHEQTKQDWQGGQIPLLEFDELTHFSETQFFYMLSRNRSTSGVRPYVRATTNPDADSWVARLIAWWIDDAGYPIAERSGVLRWFVRMGDELVWGNTREELIERFGAEYMPKSLTFIPATLKDNPALTKADPGYRANLLALSHVDRMRLLEGNWKIKAEAGTIFNRTWVQSINTLPKMVSECRYWDMAATAKTLAKDDPDFTAGVKVGRSADDHYYILDVIAVQAGPIEVERLMDRVTHADHLEAIATGADYKMRFEIEPGSASIREARRITASLAGIDARGYPSRGDKITRAKAFCSQAEMGNVTMVSAAWNERWLTHMHNQPTAPHDDIWDATAGAFNALTALQPKRARSHQG